MQNKIHEKANLKNGKAFHSKKILNLKIFNRILFILIIILSVSYIAATNDLAIRGMILSDLKQERNKLAASNNKLELEVMALSSYNIISERINNLKMVAVGHVEYINSGIEAVAKK